MRKQPPSLFKFFVNALQPTSEMNMVLPQPLARYPGLLPAIIDKAVGEAERHTYYWYFATISKAWEYMDDLVDKNQTIETFPDFKVVDGWETGRLMNAQTGPFALSITRGTNMVILVSLLPPTLSTVSQQRHVR